MIPRSQAIRQTPDWQQRISDAVRSLDELLAMLDLHPQDVNISPDAARDFSLKVPRAYVARMQPGEPQDPLLRQVLPVDEECRSWPGDRLDPVGDLNASVASGLIHKYAGRALLMTTGACAVHCRYCFRRHFPYSDTDSCRSDWQPAIDWLQRHPDISEIILSGGDPLSLSDQRLSELLEQLERVPHLQTLRIHTRLPLVVAERITGPLLKLLSGGRLQAVVVVHCNHAQELDQATCDALQQLSLHGITALNQAVLLKRVNDTLDDQVTLSQRLLQARVLPYYLHMLDPVQGAHHFRVDTASAMCLYQRMRAALPGYLLPRLVQEIPGQPGKTPLRA